ncbi:MAG: hypothetical protein ACYC27_10295 [Armatimonadota bacterium]
MIRLAYKFNVNIVPTAMGVNRWQSATPSSLKDSPHSRGGEPGSGDFDGVISVQSPQPWG